MNDDIINNEEKKEKINDEIDLNLLEQPESLKEKEEKDNINNKENSIVEKIEENKDNNNEDNSNIEKKEENNNIDDEKKKEKELNIISDSLFLFQDNFEVKKNLIWIDDEDENKEKIDKFNIIKIFNVKLFNDIEKAIEYILKIKFKETIIVLSGEIIIEFFHKISNLKNNLYVIPKIFIFTKSKEEIEPKIKDYPFYNQNNIYDNFYLLKKEIEKDETNEYYNSNFNFEYIENEQQLIIPLNYYKLILSIEPSKEEIIKFNQLLQNQFQTNNKLLLDLINQTFYCDTPIELIIKYWLKLYSYSTFANIINQNLQEKLENKFSLFTQLLYFGLKEKMIEPHLDDKLYRGGIISKEELNKIKNFKNNLNDLPNIICYTKTFITFSLDEKIAFEFLNNNKNNVKFNEELVFFEIDKEDNIIYSDNITNTNIQNISLFPEKKEILFFPYSCFEVSEISNINILNDEYIHIKLKYLGKYKNKIPEEIKDWKNIPETNFIISLIQSQIIGSEKIKNIVEENKNVFSFDIQKYLTPKEDEKINQKIKKEEIKVEDSKLDITKNLKYKWELRYQSFFEHFRVLLYSFYFF